MQHKNANMLFLLFALNLSILFNQINSNEVSSELPKTAYARIHGEVLNPVNNETQRLLGLITFHQEQADSILISVDIKGLPELKDTTISKKGFHIHTNGIKKDFGVGDNVNAICGSAGPHYNPTNESHGFLIAFTRHNGDLGNLNLNQDGTISINIIDNRVTLIGENSVIGRTIVLHEHEDDGGFGNHDLSKITGNSGARIACGLIFEGPLDNPNQL